MTCKLAICDDNKEYARFIDGLVAQWAGQSGIEASTALFPSAEAFLFQYEEERDFDILLLDVEMGGMDGVKLAKRVRREDDAVQIVFITGYTDYIAEGYEVSALHYLTKPVDEDKLFRVLTRAMGRLKRNEPALTLELPGETVRVPLSKIRYLDVLHNYVTVHADREYTVKRSLGELETELDQRFFRIGRSCILNLATVDTVVKTGNPMADAILNSKISLARSKKIQVQADASIPVALHLSELDLCVILGNLFDNAIEASLALPEEGRLIRVYMDMKGTQLYISFTNFTAVGKRNKREGRFRTTKGEGHGFGLVRIDTIVERLGGYLSRNSEDGAFTTEILLPQAGG